MKIRFISDLHLDDERPDIYQGFFHYLSALQKDTAQLYILGDLFEAFIGDDDDSDLTLKIKQHLRETTDTGCEVFLMHGNRDFLIGETFARETGCKIIHEPHRIELAEFTAILMHGDSLCTDDVEYQQFKQQIRSQSSIEFLLAQSLDDRRLLAKSLREDTKKRVEGKDLGIMNVNDNAVQASFRQHKMDILIHGHTHKPAIHDLTVDKKRRKRYVLGDWHINGYEIVFENNKLTLINFSLKDLHATHTES